MSACLLKMMTNTNLENTCTKINISQPDSKKLGWSISLVGGAKKQFYSQLITLKLIYGTLFEKIQKKPCKKKETGLIKCYDIFFKNN